MTNCNLLAVSVKGEGGGTEVTVSNFGTQQVVNFGGDVAVVSLRHLANDVCDSRTLQIASGECLKLPLLFHMFYFIKAMMSLFQIMFYSPNVHQPTQLIL